MFLFILFFNFTILYWFCHISTWIHHRYTCVPHPETQVNGKTSQADRLEDNIVKMFTLPKVVYRFTELPIQSLMSFFWEIQKNHPKIHMESQWPWWAKKILKKKTTLEASHVLISKHITELIFRYNELKCSTTHLKQLSLKYNELLIDLFYLFTTK